jgi:hypothetical protein
MAEAARGAQRQWAEAVEICLPQSKLLAAPKSFSLQEAQASR